MASKFLLSAGHYVVKIVDVLDLSLERIPEHFLAGSRGDDHLTRIRTEWIQDWFIVFVRLHLLVSPFSKK